ncbi:hypothetical protein [Tsukamurella strandjordii]|uniref:Uncharacterized protein n=1 Tax=Tsukamurella strandjordii TaxID=147577 RepID=A0AA90NKF9_9ACTN|nr:hypothetical protein [Tsukamurella strandjordii]MDP0400515.1 hypothetical protein [Tsukamurella strandjordii]
MTSTGTNSRSATEVLADARASRSADKRARVYAAVDKLKQSPHPPITFAAVARAAQVSRWLTYTDDIRCYIEQAQRQQREVQVAGSGAGNTASALSLKTDLALARDQLRKQRTEIAQLKDAIRRHVGAQLDHVSIQQLRQRIDELLSANTNLAEENTRLRHQLDATTTDLAAARASLKQMIREASTQQR